MDDIKELERRWYFYKLKKSLLSLNAVALTMMFGLGGYYSYIKADSIKSFFNEKMLIAQNKDMDSSKTAMVEPVLVAKATEKAVVHTLQKVEVVNTSKNEGLSDKSMLHEVSLEPIIPIVDMEKENRKSSMVHKRVSKKVYTQKKHRAVNSQIKMVKAKASTYLTASELETIRREVALLDSENIKKINLNGTSANYIETMIKKFSKSKNPREALLLAKAFYGKGDYHNSEKWALVANKLDSSKDESWHIFAKSKFKLGKKSEALKILSSYYNKSHSAKTKALILKIKTERL